MTTSKPTHDESNSAPITEGLKVTGGFIGVIISLLGVITASLVCVQTLMPLLPTSSVTNTPTFVPTNTSPSVSSGEYKRYIGNVYDKTTERPISGAEVRVFITGIPDEKVFTDDYGSFFVNLKLLPIQYAGRIEVFKEGYEVHKENINLFPDVSNLKDIMLIPIPTPTPEGNGTGALPVLHNEQWAVQFFGNADLESSVIYQSLINADKNSEGGYSLNFLSSNKPTEIGSSEYSIRFSGIFPFKQSGKYEFYCDHQDGCRVFVDSRSWIDAWWDGTGSHSIAREISAGTHIVVVEFYDLQSTGNLGVYWRLKK